MSKRIFPVHLPPTGFPSWRVSFTRKLAWTSCTSCAWPVFLAPPGDIRAAAISRSWSSGRRRKAAHLRVVEDFFATPTYAPVLASRSIDLLERSAFGLYHIGGGTLVSWYQYALKILAAGDLEADIQPTNHREFSTPARRPMRSGLSNAKIERLGLAKMPPLDEALADYMERRKQVKTPRAHHS